MAVTVREGFEPHKHQFQEGWNALWSFEAWRREAVSRCAMDFTAARVSNDREAQLAALRRLGEEVGGDPKAVAALNALDYLDHLCGRSDQDPADILADLIELGFLPTDVPEARAFLLTFLQAQA